MRFNKKLLCLITDCIFYCKAHVGTSSLNPLTDETCKLIISFFLARLPSLLNNVGFGVVLLVVLLIL